jgi:hypothetical protein
MAQCIFPPIQLIYANKNILKKRNGESRSEEVRPLNFTLWRRIRLGGDEMDIQSYQK